MGKNSICEIKVSYADNTREATKITNSEITYRLFISCWNKGTIQLQEEFKILLLNRANKVLGIYPVSRGGVSGTLVDPKLVFSVALKCNASSIILGHNHPSGNLNPSEADKALTRKLIKAGGYLDVKVLDHLIITPKSYFSFMDENLMS
ncbi:JAB domain-containing protein [Gramella jeungdoensis]|uniref:JAB domain-containing protein n=1 Tax=Gramella jeungdoensis TaxID=708091 RepID=A0ABT0Z1X0_9FLAO|nr:JAB domain-containing protein [Gramella jeungdoensis]MCM8569704.1 JAB domain-containing protein [Gramella jeungdoensis]